MNHIHPVIRVVLFFVFGISVAFGSVPQLLLATILIVLGYASVRFENASVSWAMIKRMRWLFLSILIVYLWFTPGHELLPFLKKASPTIEGLEQGFLRIYSLFLIVVGVNLLVRSIHREELIRAILWLLKPFRYVGLPYERLAIRVALTFDFVGEVQTMYRSSSVSPPNNAVDNESLQNVVSKRMWDRIAKRLMWIGDTAVVLFQNVLDKAATTESHNVSIPVNNAPPVMQWLYVLALLAICLYLPVVYRIV